MFGELTLFVVLQAAALIAAGAVAGYFLAVQRFDKQRDKLRDELDEARNELKEHREQVDSHFLKTGLLFNRLTDSYREIYEHLATGAQSLCSTEVTKMQLDQPETRVLPSVAATAAGIATEAADDASTTTASDADSPAEDKTAAAENAAEDSSVKTDADTVAADSNENTDAATTEAASEKSADNEEKTAVPANASDAAAAQSDTDETSDATKDAAANDAEKPAAADVAAIDEKTADDEHIGADAAPAPTLAAEKAASVDQHKSPPSIH